MALKLVFDVDIFDGFAVSVLVLANNFCSNTMVYIFVYLIGEQC